MKYLGNAFYFILALATSEAVEAQALVPNIFYSAWATCTDENGDQVADYGQYYIEIIVDSLQQSQNLIVHYLNQSKSIAVGPGALPDTTHIGPFAHSGNGNEYETITIEQPSSGLSDILHVAEALCGYESHRGLNRAGYVCNPGKIDLVACNSPPIATFSNIKPVQYIYVLVDQAPDTIMEINQAGLFEDYPNTRSYKIYAFSLTAEDMPAFLTEFITGDQLDLSGIDECYTFCGDFEIEPACIQYDLALKVEPYGDFVQWGDTVRFEITIYNQGNIGATNIEITDYVPSGFSLGPPSPAFAPGENKSLQKNASLLPWFLNSNGFAVATVADTIQPLDSLVLIINLIANTGSQLNDLINFVEISGGVDENGIERMDEDSTPDDIKDNDDLVDNVISNSANDEDDHDIAIPSVFDLALRKTIVGTSVVSTGDEVQFLIEVFNQGNEQATNVELGDFAFEGFIFDQSTNPDWKIIDDHFETTWQIDIAPGEIDSSYISFTIAPNAQTLNLINYAEIIGTDDKNGNNGNALDIDSEPDGIIDNDQGGLPGSSSDDEINDSGDKDEDDHDPAAMIICTPFQCKGNINLGLGDDCRLDLVPEMFLTQITFDSSQYVITVVNAAGDTVGIQLGPDDLGKTFKVTISIVGAQCPDNVCHVDMLVEDKIAPSIVCTSDTVSCLDSLAFDLDTLSSCNQIMVELLQDDFTQLCDNDSIIGKRTRTFRLVDQSGNTSQNCTADFFIKVPDIQNVITPQDTILACDKAVFSNQGELLNDLGVPQLNGMPLFPNAFEDCNIIAAFTDQIIFDTPCKKQILRMWSIHKWTCGGGDSEVSRPQLITIVDTLPPVITLANDTLQLKADSTDCLAKALFTDLTVTDTCSGQVETTIFSPFGSVKHGQGESLKLPIGTHDIFIQAVDICHNVTRDTVIVEVTDGGAPLAICLLNTSVTLTDSASTEVMADVFDISSGDACSDIQLMVRKMNRSCEDADTVFSDRVKFCCADIGAEVMVVLRVVDTTGNFSECIVRVNVLDGGSFCVNPLTFKIDGTVRSMYGEEMEGVLVKINAFEENTIYDEITDKLGRYDFGDMTQDTDYSIAPLKNDDWPNGVSTLDLITIQNHILGTKKFESAFQFIAGDVNADQSISAIDLVVLRKLILGITDEIESNTSWRFAWSGQSLAAESADAQIQPMEKYVILALTRNMYVDWEGVKVGDLTGNAEVQNLIKAEGRSSRKVELTYEVEQSGASAVVQFYSPDLQAFKGLQLCLESNADVKITDLIKGQLDIEAGHMRILPNAQVMISHNRIEAIDMTKEKPLFSLMLDRLRPEDYASFFVNNNKMHGEIYYNGEVAELDLTSQYDYEIERIRIHNNYPNPWGNNTLVSFAIPNEGKVDWSVYDIQNRLINRGSGQFLRGRNEIVLTNKDVPYKGAMILELTSLVSRYN